jgi:hypothetical protein
MCTGDGEGVVTVEIVALRGINKSYLSIYLSIEILT